MAEMGKRKVASESWWLMANAKSLSREKMQCCRKGVAEQTRRATTHSFYEMLQAQLDGQGSLAYTTIAQHHNLVRRCKSSSHCRVRGSGKSAKA